MNTRATMHAVLTCVRIAHVRHTLGYSAVGSRHVCVGVWRRECVRAFQLRMCARLSRVALADMRAHVRNEAIPVTLRMTFLLALVPVRVRIVHSPHAITNQPSCGSIC
jgi:hypothetical protein